MLRARLNAARIHAEMIDEPTAWHAERSVRAARENPELGSVKSYLAVFSGALLLVSLWMLQRAHMDARKYVPLQFADDFSSRYYMLYVLFNRTMPLEIRRRFAVASALWLVARRGLRRGGLSHRQSCHRCVVASDLRLRGREHRLAVE